MIFLEICQICCCFCAFPMKVLSHLLFQQLHPKTHAATTGPSMQPTASKLSRNKTKFDVIKEISPLAGIALLVLLVTHRCPIHVHLCVVVVPTPQDGSKGQHPSVADGEVTREVCYHWLNNCCRWKNNIKVKNCGAFYVYELEQTPVCSLRYCGECSLSLGENVDTHNLAKLKQLFNNYSMSARWIWDDR